MIIVPATNVALISVVNVMLQQRREEEERARKRARIKEERARKRARIKQETDEYNRIKESALKKASEPEKVLATYSNGQVKEKTEHGYHYEYYEDGKTKSVTNVTGTIHEYDEEGTLRREFIPYDGEYIYDSLGRLIKEKDSLETKEYFYYGESFCKEHVIVKDKTDKITSYQHLTKEGRDNTEDYLHRLEKIKRLKAIVAKKYGREEDKDGNVSYDITKDTSKGSVLTFKDRMLARVREVFEK